MEHFLDSISSGLVVHSKNCLDKRVILCDSMSVEEKNATRETLDANHQSE
jgi:hypothetical protein